MQNETVATDSHKIHLPQTGKFEIGEDYKFVNRNVFFVIGSVLFKFLIIYPIFFPITKIFLGFKVIGAGNIKKIKGGAVSVSNHAHILDAPMINFSLFPRQPSTTSLKGNFQTPGVSFLVKILGAVPIPETPKALAAFFDAMANETQRSRIVHFYPEASLWPGHNELRPFKKGAFHLAVNAGVPILPMVIKQREPRGLFKLYKKKPCISVVIGEPIEANTSLNTKQGILDLRQRAHDAMRNILES